jgi:hypothetical protein
MLLPHCHSLACVAARWLPSSLDVAAMRAFWSLNFSCRARCASVCKQV